MVYKHSKGIAHIGIVIVVLLILGILTVIAVSSWQKVTVDSTEDVRKILAKNCPSEEELAAAERYIQEAGLDDLLDDIGAKRNEPSCSISIIEPEMGKCVIPYAMPGPGDPFGETTCTPCHFIHDIKSRQQVGNECLSETWARPQCDEWDVINYEADGLVSCYKMWGIDEEDIEEIETDTNLEVDIPVGFENQYDFGSYQDPDVVPTELELEPLVP